jgi:hypothetical protein
MAALTGVLTTDGFLYGMVAYQISLRLTALLQTCCLFPHQQLACLMDVVVSRKLIT